MAIAISVSIKPLAAQGKGFNSGYYVTLSDDTLHGYISFETKKEMNSFFYKPTSVDKEFQVVKIDSCKSVATAQAAYYIYTVKRSMEYIDKFTYTIMNKDSMVTAAIPLKLLFSGSRFSLFHYEDIRPHFFFYNGNEMQELAISYRYLTEGEIIQLKLYNLPKYIINKDYHRQIVAALDYQITQKQWDMIQETEYEEKPMIRLFRSLDGKNKPVLLKQISN